MAFPIPDHLPRKGNPQDVSTRILSAISETSSKGLTAQVASTWVAELDDAMSLTKKRIHDKIHEDLPLFERQLESSRSIQQRLRSLTGNVDEISNSLSNSESGLIPKLLRDLVAHATLAQEAIDASVKLEALEHLALCRKEYRNFTSALADGKLPDAKSSSAVSQILMEEAPLSLTQTKLFRHLSREFQTLKARTDEQLDDAYSRSIVVSASELVIRRMVQVRQSETALSLPSVLASLSPETLSAHLSTLRRDLTTYFIDYLSTQPLSLTSTDEEDIPGAPTYRLASFHSPPNTEIRSAYLDNLSTLLSFLNVHLFPSIPESHNRQFRQSLCKPVTNAALQNILIPSLPSTLSQLPQFLKLADQAVKFEKDCISGILGDPIHDKEIKAWVNGISGHYERKRRIEILERARIVIIEVDDPTQTFRAEVATTPEVTPPMVEVVQDDAADDSAWGLEDQKATNGDDAIDEDGWGLDEDEPAAETDPERPTEPETKGVEPSDPWGWNEEEETTAVEDNPDQIEDDNPWDDDPWNDPPQKPEEALPPPLPVSPAPKPATRLEKFSTKAAKNGRSSIDSPAATPLPPSVPHTPALPPPPPPAPAKKLDKRPETLKVPAVDVIKESYLVSSRVKEILSMVTDILQESKEFAESKIFPSTSSSSPPGTLLTQTASLVLDLYRALYPVKFSSKLERSPSRSMQYSNDCLYLSGELDQVGSGIGSVKGKLSECKDRLKVLGESWFYYSIEKEERTINDILSRAEGFVEVADQEQFDECESAVNETLRHIRRLAQQWKSVLQKSKYYTAVGLVADAALSRILSDILALSDIPEVDSHKLSELCRILDALQGLFVEDPDRPSVVVVYVPSWLKFSYLSELMEASIADITYLFEEGALVDFEIEELVKLVRALFADTPLRTNTINKLMKGHPAPH